MSSRSMYFCFTIIVDAEFPRLASLSKSIIKHIAFKFIRRKYITKNNSHGSHNQRRSTPGDREKEGR